MIDVSAAVRDGWRAHAESPGPVFDGLPALAAAADTPERAGEVLGLAFHVGCEHLREDARVAALAADLGARFPEAPGPRRVRAAVDALASGALPPPAPAADELPLLALVLPAAAARGADDLLTAGLARAEVAAVELPDDHRAVRGLAAATNNVACALEERAARSALADDALRAAARQARAAWGRAGTWVEVERAEYRLAKAHLALGEPAAARRHAEACLAGCLANGADPGERVFGWEIVARAAAAEGDADRARAALTEGRALLDGLEPGLAAYARDALDGVGV